MYLPDVNMHSVLSSARMCGALMVREGLLEEVGFACSVEAGRKRK